MANIRDDIGAERFANELLISAKSCCCGFAEGSIQSVGCQHADLLAETVSGVARPTIVPRVNDHAGSYWVELDVA